MAQTTINVSDEWYQQNGGTWWAPDGGTALYAGKTSGSNVYRALFEFSSTDIAALQNIKSLKFRVYRFAGSGTSGSKTLSFQIGSGKTTSGITLVGSAVTATLATENAWYEIDLTSLASSLSADNRFVCIHSSTSGTYSAFRPHDVSGYGAQLLAECGVSGKIKVSGAWHDIVAMKIKVNNAWHDVTALKVKVGSSWHDI